MREFSGKLLLTGASGFVGAYVQRVLDCSPLDDDDGIIDLRDPDRVDAAVDALRPDAVLHLAAQSFVPESFRDPASTFMVNVIGTINLLRALERTGFSGRFLYVSSGEVYGLVPETALPVDESTPTLPRNPYAASKVAAEAVCYQWSQSARFSVTVARPFNHIGPGQSHRFAIADFASQLARISAGLSDPVLTVGDIDVTRDFCDVRDVVRAYAGLLASAESGETYNICSGKEYRLRSLIEKLARMAGLEIRIEQDPGRFRPSEQRRMLGSCERLRLATGWEPTIEIDDSLRDIMNHELEALST